MATAPPLDDPLEYEIIELQRVIEELKEKNYNLNLALLTIEFQSLNSEVKRLQNTVSNMNSAECDDQCEQANRQTETHTVDDFLKKNINLIFNI